MTTILLKSNPISPKAVGDLEVLQEKSFSKDWPSLRSVMLVRAQGMYFLLRTVYVDRSRDGHGARSFSFIALAPKTDNRNLARETGGYYVPSVKDIKTLEWFSCQSGQKILREWWWGDLPEDSEEVDSWLATLERRPFISRAKYAELVKRPRPKAGSIFQSSKRLIQRWAQERKMDAEKAAHERELLKAK